MKKKYLKRIIVLYVVLLSAATTCRGQYYYAPTDHDDYANIFLSAGYQYLNHSIGTFNAATLHAEVLYSFVGSRVGLTVAPDYFSFSPFGILMFAPKLLGATLSDMGDGPPGAVLVVYATILAATQFHIPLTDHIEISLGWDALKFTKFRKFEDKFYLSGSLNAGVIGFLGDHFYFNGYYEYNHTHNSAINGINWTLDQLELGGDLKSQPNILNGHSFGARIGVMF